LPLAEKSVAPIGCRKKLNPMPSARLNSCSRVDVCCVGLSLFQISHAEESVNEAPKASMV
jgi:hypothetical protein